MNDKNNAQVKNTACVFSIAVIKLFDERVECIHISIYS